jgi:hypothetical protein
MKPEIIRDRTLDWFEALMNSPWCDRMCWIVIIVAALYFGPTIVKILVG